MRRFLLCLTVFTLLLVSPVNTILASQPHTLIPPGSVYDYDLSFDKRNDHSANSPLEIQGAASYLGKERNTLTEDNCHLNLELVVGAALSEFRREVEGTGTLFVEELELEFAVTGEVRAMQVQGEAYIYATLSGQIDTLQGPVPISMGLQSWQDKAHIPLRIGSYEGEDGMLSLSFGRSFNEMSDAFTLESCWPDGRYITGETKPFVVEAFTHQGAPAAGAIVYIRKDLDNTPITLFSGKTDAQGRIAFAFDKGVLDLEAGPHNFGIHAISAEGKLIVWHWSEDEDFLKSDDTLLITARFGESSFQGGAVACEHIPTPAVPEIVLTFCPGEDMLRVQNGAETSQVALPLAPLISEGHLLVPVRPLLQQLGYRVKWLPADNTIHISGKGHVLRLVPGNSVAELDEQEIQLEQPVLIRMDRALVPLRQIANLLGHGVKWKAEPQQAVVR